ncbi:MAG: DMT family transporter [Nitriliruptoraceae bacterium]
MSTRPAPTTRAAGTFGPVEAVLLVLLSSMWGLSFLFIELALRDLTPIWIVALRTVVGGATLLGLLALRRGSLPRTRRLWGTVLLLGVVNNAAPWTLLAWAQQSLPSGLAGLLMALVPTSTLLVAAAVGLERLTRTRLAGLLLALVGVAAIAGGDLEQPGRVLAVIAVVAATLLYALGAVLAKQRASGTAPPLTIAAGQVLGAAVVSTPVALATSGPLEVAGVSGRSWLAVSLLGMLGTGLAFLVFYVLVERVGATNATLTTYLIPIVAVVAGAVVLDERLGPSALVGGALILAGIWLAQRAASHSPPAH